MKTPVPVRRVLVEMRERAQSELERAKRQEAGMRISLEDATKATARVARELAEVEEFIREIRLDDDA